MARFAAACALLFLAISAQATFTSKSGPVDAMLNLKKKALCQKLAKLGNDQEEACKEVMAEKKKEKETEIIYVTKVAPKSTAPVVAPKATAPAINAKKTGPTTTQPTQPKKTAQAVQAKKTAQPVHPPTYPLKVVKVAQPTPTNAPTEAPEEPARKALPARGKILKILNP